MRRLILILALLPASLFAQGNTTGRSYPGASPNQASVNVGIVPNAQTGTTYTYLYSDRGGYVTFSNGSSIAVTLPQANSAGFTQNYFTSSCAIGAGTVTITPTTSTISYTTGSNYTSAASSMALTKGVCAFIYSDNTNYFAIQFLAGGGSSAFPITVSGTVNSGGIPCFTSTTIEASSALLTQYGVVLGGGAGVCPTSTAQGASAMPLIGQGAANPIFSTIAYPSSATSGGVVYASSTTALALSALMTAGQFMLGGGAGSAPTTSFSVVPAPNGGTGVASPTAHQDPEAEGSSVYNFVSPSTTGYCKLSNGTSADPSYQQCPVGAGIIGTDASTVTIIAATPVYIPAAGGGLSSTTVANVDQGAPQAFTVSNLYVQVSSAPGAGNTFVIAFRDAATSEALTCTISGASATSCNDTTHTFTGAAADLIDWKLSATGTIVVTPNIIISAQWNGPQVVNRTVTMFAAYAGCNNGTAASSWDLPTSSAAVAACKTGGTSSTVQGTLQFADASLAYYTVQLPHNFVSFANARLSFTTSDTTNGHTIIPAMATLCTQPNNNVIDDAAYNSTQAFTTVTIGGGATANATYGTSLASPTSTGCAADYILHLKLTRNTDTDTDTSVAYTGGLILEMTVTPQ